MRGSEGNERSKLPNVAIYDKLTPPLVASFLAHCSWSVPLCPNDNPSKGFKDPKTILIGRTMFETDR